MFSTVLSVFFFFIGVLSAYNPAPSQGTIAYRQYSGEIPADLSAYEALLAVDHCGLIGHEAVLHAGGREFPALIFDCAGSWGAQFFSDGNDPNTPWLLAGDVDNEFWKKHPDIVRTKVRIEVLPHKWNDNLE